MPVRERGVRSGLGEDSTCLFLATLPERAYIPDLTILTGALQALGKTTAPPPVEGGT